VHVAEVFFEPLQHVPFQVQGTGCNGMRGISGGCFLSPGSCQKKGIVADTSLPAQQAACDIKFELEILIC